MPTSPQAAPSTSAGNYVKFSDKLTDSLHDITKMINEHKAMIDAIQEVGIQLTDTLGALHTVTAQYAGVVNGALDVLLPVLKTMPFVPPQLLDVATNMEHITQQIIDTKATTAKAITDVNTGLKTGDAERLRGHADELKNLSASLLAILPKVKP